MRTLLPPVFLALLASSAAAEPAAKRFVAAFSGLSGSQTVGAGLVIGPDGAIYTAARISTPGQWGSRWALTKSTPDGLLLWSREGFTGPADDRDRPASLAIDPFGDLIVAWDSPDAPILKFDPADGATIWTAPFAPSGPSYPGVAAAVVGPDGSTFVTGQGAPGADQDWITVKLSPAGAVLWTAREDGTYGGPDGINDAPASLTLDADGALYVAGSLQVGDDEDAEQTLFAPAVVKYDASGRRLWRAVLGDWRHTGDGVRVLAARDGNPILIANIPGAILTAKLDAASGAPLWSDVWTGAAGDGALAFDARLNPDGDPVIVGGACGDTPFCAGGLSTRRLRAADGAEVWSAYFFDAADPLPYSASARALAFGPGGTVYAVGRHCYGLFGFSRRAVLLAYDGDSGAPLWSDVFLPDAADQTHFSAVAVDPGGDPVVVGARRQTGARGHAMLTIRYGCAADFNADGFVDFFDYDAFVACFESGACPPNRTPDINNDGFTDFFDYDAFVTVYELGC